MHVTVTADSSVCLVGLLANLLAIRFICRLLPACLLFSLVDVGLDPDVTTNLTHTGVPSQLHYRTQHRRRQFFGRRC